jgi:hypothetical protein
MAQEWLLRENNRRLAAARDELGIEKLPASLHIDNEAIPPGPRRGRPELPNRACLHARCLQRTQAARAPGLPDRSERPPPILHRCHLIVGRSPFADQAISAISEKCQRTASGRSLKRLPLSRVQRRRASTAAGRSPGPTSSGRQRSGVAPRVSVPRSRFGSRLTVGTPLIPRALGDSATCTRAARQSSARSVA